MRACLVAGAVLGLAGCSSAPGADPIAWWRQLEGGRLAEERPLPPNADAPYPNLGSVPARPTATGAAARAQIAAHLAGDQRDGAYATAQPIPPVGPRPDAPPPAPAGGIGASLTAASAAPAPPTPPAAAAPAAVPRPAPAAVAAAPATSGVELTLPAAPPPAPRLPGVAAATVPAPAPRAPPPAAPPAARFAPGAPVGIAFAPGSAVLPEGAAAALRRLAATRAGRDLWVAGYGESPATDAASQAATLSLAFARARAMAGVLGQAGVPAGSLRITGEAIGRGGVARVAQ